MAAKRLATSVADYNDDDDDDNGDDDPFGQQIDPDLLIQQQRDRRQAIMAKYADQAKPKSSIIIPMVVEKSAHQQIPLQDIPEKSKEPSLSIKIDMFDTEQELNLDDKNIDQATILQSEPVIRTFGNNLTDNWDDAEGYYRIILGEVLDNRYHVYTTLGKGVFSSVVRAKDKLDNSDVAIKIIRNNEVMYKAGLKELRILKNLQDIDPTNKKHCVRFFRHFEHKFHLCMVFESLSLNLRQVLQKFGKNVGITISAVQIYAKQLVLSLSLLMAANIIHADIKPDNILVTESKSVLKLADFGSASDISENEITPYLVSRFYRAPEIRIPYDTSIDIWSVAATLFELYTGELLFPGRTNNQMLKLMMDLKGKFPNKMLKRGQFHKQHFDDSFNFLHSRLDTVSGKMTARSMVVAVKPINDLKSRISAALEGGLSGTILGNFIDFLEKALTLNPEKRLTVTEALQHPFITR